MHLPRKSARALTGLAALGLTAAPPAGALALDGTTRTGSITFNGGATNYYDPVNRFVPVGFSNTAGPAVLDVADFRDGQLILSDVTALGQDAGPATCTFTDSAFTTVSSIFENFNGGLTYTLVGNTLTISTGAYAPANGVTREAIFNSNQPVPAVPEASMTVSRGLLLSLGMAGLLVAAKRRKAAGSPAA